MRLTPRQQQIIREAARDVFGTEARVWLFGSRVDDSRRGGDIDLYYLRTVGERTGTVIDNLNRAEQLGLVKQVDD